MVTPAAKPVRRWHRIKMSWIAERMEADAPTRRVRWQLGIGPGATAMQLLNPRGRRYDFKLNGGCWIRRAEVKKI